MARNDLFSLDGKVALVTGASSGLGQAMAIALATYGADLFLVSHTNRAGLAETAARVEALGRRAEVFPFDLGREDCGRVVERCVASLGSVDILVNNAGIIEREPAERHGLDVWERVMRVNARAIFLLSQAAGRHMLRKGYGKIINVASVLSFQGGILVPSYAASKGAVVQLTRALANEWAGRGVNVNAIAPGYMRTANTRPLQEDPERSRAILDRIPAGRWGVPDDLAGSVVFLASRASDYVHGHVLCVDGGWLSR
ncbi:MAG TPA: 2-dehydro-3-deoxy-D-gluconate 5-dehydrogenase KduD [Limnochordia bacterium]